jgi:hypothetical protein
MDRLIEERGDESKQQKVGELVFKVERMQEYLNDLSMQEISISTKEVLRGGILTLDPLREQQQCEVTTLGEDKNKNGKMILETVRETQITRKKARKISKKKAKLENLREAIDTIWKTSQSRTSQGAGS